MTKVGRKRNFDKSEALDKAMRVFWEHGYNGTSLSDLTDALDINKPSLYAAFGNKEALFNASLTHYLKHYGVQTDLLLKPESMPLTQRLAQYVHAISQNITGTKTPKGCFFVKSCYESGSNKMPAESADFLASSAQEFEQVLESFFVQEQQKGNIDQSQDAKSLSLYFASLLYGLSTMARNGKSKDTLKAAASVALANFPVKA